jgi:hypothetical protein
MSSWYVRCLQEEYVCWRHDSYNQGEAASSDGEDLFFYFFHSAHCRLFHWISISILDFSCTHKTVWSRMARADISVPFFNLNDTVRYIRCTAAINLVTQMLEAILQTHRPPFFGAPHRQVFPFFPSSSYSSKFVSLSKMVWRRVAPLSSLMTSKHGIIISRRIGKTRNARASSSSSSSAFIFATRAAHE